MNVAILPAFSAAADLQLFHCAWWQLSESPTPMVLGWGQNDERSD
jgi:hypothetical protein